MFIMYICFSDSRSLHNMTYRLLSFLFIICLFSCATPSTQNVYIDPEKVKQEEKIQKELAFRKYLQYQERLRKVSYPILTKNTDFCPDDLSASLGVLWSSLNDYPEDQREVAAQILGVNEGLRITRVEPNSSASRNGIIKGDEVLSINGNSVGYKKRDRQKFLNNLSKEFKKRPYDLVSMEIDRKGKRLDLQFIPDKICNFPVLFSDTDEVNAYANGAAVIITKGMLRFVESDTELGLVIGHELGHNVMNHMDKKRTNYLLGSIFDIAAAAYGVNTQGAFGSAAMQVYSQEFEAEADYVGLYYLHRAGYKIEDAVYFWRNFAAEHPGSIRANHAASHPATSERFIAMESVISEIKNKEFNSLPIQPEFKDGNTYEVSESLNENSSQPLTEKEKEIEALRKRIKELEKESDSNKNSNEEDNGQVYKPKNVKAITNLGTKPILKKSYPLEISINKKQIDQSSVVIIFDVSIEGEVFNASVYQSSGDRMVDSLALESVRRSIYSPSLLDGKPVIYRKMKKRFRFNL